MIFTKDCVVLALHSTDSQTPHLQTSRQACKGRRQDARSCFACTVERGRGAQAALHLWPLRLQAAQRRDASCTSKSVHEQCAAQMCCREVTTVQAALHLWPLRLDASQRCDMCVPCCTSKRQLQGPRSNNCSATNCGVGRAALQLQPLCL